MTPKKAIETISRIRKSGIMIPIIVMTYYNIIFANGLPGFIKKIKDVGADGLVVPDVPLEEANELDNICKEQGITLAYFITPNMSEERIKKITDKASGFLYAVSVIGTTGTRPHVALEAIELVKRAKKLTKIPVVAGFGISTPEQAAEFASAGANGVIAGSKFVEIYSKHIIDEELNEENALDEVKKFVGEMARAIATPPSLSL
jgi:tryptophan synthase alpha chain